MLRTAGCQRKGLKKNGEEKYKIITETMLALEMSLFRAIIDIYIYIYIYSAEIQRNQTVKLRH